ncbi:DUF3107 domain-containing protein [Sediminivirga luteola]|uniref:ATP-binding protein n=1 Tax=Sediminivirga luteola TaxID=1774748 RepID=A0A8J2XK73_9MICO|nr:DUF3107 domain-containing protein [Sediminivirga luteola]MCI2265685.1 DUF3107 domain-containing protein [Sediminivirga luteola]GGA07427.1 ATP-binding protein [Sediminivirga luteola]
MEIKIGVQNAARELSIESELSADELVALVDEALAKGSTLVLGDAKGRRIAVPAAALAYVETGAETVHRVGFTV